MSSSLTKINLTTRQRQILDIIVTRGVSNKIIARMLHISESTVKLHISSKRTHLAAGHGKMELIIGKETFIPAKKWLFL